MIENNVVMMAVDKLTVVGSSLDYLEDVTENRISCILTMIHQEIDKITESLMEIAKK
jgi:hypothetical protein